MPRYYFHVRTTGDLVTDPEGSDLVDLMAARAEAIANARGAMSASILEGIDLSGSAAVEIHDDTGRLLMRVPYSDAIRRVQFT